jgi:FkbM family methyltransferase
MQPAHEQSAANLRNYAVVPELHLAVRGDAAWLHMVRERAWWRQSMVCERVGHCAKIPVYFLPIPGDVRVCVKFEWSATTGVLLEFGDWFESESAFVRRCLVPSSLAIDIGANHGVFALPMAKAASEGRVWAFEPSDTTADLLETSKHANALQNLHVVRQAVSDTAGTAEFVITEMGSEYNHLVFEASHQAAPSQVVQGKRQNVTVTTLDDLMTRHGWEEMDFIKIDAEVALPAGPPGRTWLPARPHACHTRTQTYTYVQARERSSTSSGAASDFSRSSRRSSCLKSSTRASGRTCS